jgi:hypothetical protein
LALIIAWQGFYSFLSLFYYVFFFFFSLIQVKGRKPVKLLSMLRKSLKNVFSTIFIFFYFSLYFSFFYFISFFFYFFFLLFFRLHLHLLPLFLCVLLGHLIF